ncbi:MAG: glycosyltransferase [Eubacteriales bacterium]
MRVLVLSITTGQGHNSTGKALIDYFATIGVDAKMVDAYELVSKMLATSLDKGYLMSTKNMKQGYKVLYRMWETRHIDRSETSAMRMASRIQAHKLRAFIENYNPDAIICTHVLSAILADILKQEGSCGVPVYGIVTDFVFHPFWEEAHHIDYVVTASELLNIQAFRKGFKREQILPFGIPINPKFAKHENKRQASRRLNLNPEVFTVLLMGGSMGFGNMTSTLKKLDSLSLEMQIIIVCGNNKKAKDEIDKLETKKKILCYGFVDNVDQLMDASDCIITKPGGLTTSEALAKNLPILMINPIPGQEDRNVEFLLNNGMGMYITKTTPLDEIVFQFFLYPEKIANMKRNIALLSKPESSREICEFVKNEYIRTKNS